MEGGAARREQNAKAPMPHTPAPRDPLRAHTGSCPLTFMIDSTE
jgi:hypothetical protein